MKELLNALGIDSLLNEVLDKVMIQNMDIQEATKDLPLTMRKIIIEALAERE